MRIASEGLLGIQADGAERALHQFPRFRAGVGEAELADRHGQQMIHLVERVVDFIRVLEDRLDLAAVRDQLPAIQFRDIQAAVQELAVREPKVR